MRTAVVLLMMLGCVYVESAIELNALSGSFQSPQYPQPYPDDQNITWIIRGNPGYQVVVYFSVFELEDSYDEVEGGSCAYDYVEVENLGTRKRFCGNAVNFPHDAPASYQRFRSAGEVTTITFVSDYSNEEPRPDGFLGHYYVDDKDECQELSDKVRNAGEDWDELLYCNHFCINVPGSYYCTCRPGFTLNTNKHTCSADCSDQMLTTDSGVITSPDYPEAYSKLTDCDWTIQVRTGLSLNLMFDTTFDVEDHYNYSDCPYDWLKLSYSDQENTFCGSTAPESGSLIRTNVQLAKLEFHTDLAIEKAGFRVSYSTTRVRCPHIASLLNGRLTSDASGKGYYEFEDEIRFECNIGYRLIGDGFVTCLNNGEWDNPIPVCQIKTCKTPNHLLRHSHIIERDVYEYLHMINIECDTWYEFVSGTTSWICNENEEWVPTNPSEQGSAMPVCKPVCGEKNGGHGSILSVHISGGAVAKRNEYPWMVFLHIGLKANVAASQANCGGSLISPEYVLTAAHCVTDLETMEERSAEHVFVWLGVHDRLEDRSGNTPARSVRVSQIIRHPDYHRRYWDSDFALLRLAEYVIMNNVTRPICLPEPHSTQLEIGRAAGEVAGWGLVNAFGLSSTVLRKAAMPTVTKKECWQKFQRVAQTTANFKLPPGLNITEHMFCAGSPTGKLGNTCQGDSGGPFMLRNNNNNKYTTYGAVSFGLTRDRCGQSLSYSVFAKLDDDMVTWVKTQASLN